MGGGNGHTTLDPYAYYTREETAKILRIGVGAVRKLIKSGDLEVDFRLGKRGKVMGSSIAHQQDRERARRARPLRRAPKGRPGDRIRRRFAGKDCE